MKAITTTYHGPTNTRGSRIIADDGDGNRFSVSYRSKLNSGENHAAACKGLCKSMGWGGRMQGGSLLKAGKTFCCVFVWLDKAEQVYVKPLKAFAHPAK